MILTIDIGNTLINFGIFENSQLILRFSLPASTRTTSKKCWRKLQVFLTPEMKIEGAICCSVVPDLTGMIDSFVNEYLKIPLKKFQHGADIGITNKYSVPEQVGADRLVNALAVKQLYSLPAIIVDLGTAITLDIVNDESEYIGGIIAPGLGISVEALFKKTSLLPKAELLIPLQIIGKDTLSSMQSGLTYGFAGMIENLIEAIKKELGLEEIAVIATGGYTRILEPLINDIATTIDENLTLKGLNLAYSLI